MRKLLLSLCIVCCVFVSRSFAQDITEKVKKEQEQVIKILKKDNRWKEENKEKEFFSAHVAVGLYYYNQAIPHHEEMSKGTLNDHLSDNLSSQIKSSEMKQNQYLSKALPYFENAYFIQKNNDIGNMLKDMYAVMGKNKTLADITQMADL